MFSSRRYRRYGLVPAQGLFLLALLVSVPNVRADQITYNICNYPSLQTDLINGGTDTLSGTITVNATGWNDWNGFESASNVGVASGSVFVTTPVGQVYGGSVWAENGLVATDTQLLYPIGIGDTLNGTAYYTSYENNIVIQCGVANFPFGADFHLGPGWQCTAFPLGFPTDLFIDENPTDLAQSGIEYSSPPEGGASEYTTYLVIAEVPEPASLTLLMSALLGLAGASYLRRRGTRA
jgi:hypothetical protein